MDPGFAPPYASMAELFIWSGGAGTLTTIATGVRDMHVLARQWAEKALAIDDSVPEAHNTLAMAKQTELDWAGAEREYRRWLERDYVAVRSDDGAHFEPLTGDRLPVDAAEVILSVLMGGG